MQNTQKLVVIFPEGETEDWMNSVLSRCETRAKTGKEVGLMQMPIHPDICKLHIKT